MNPEKTVAPDPDIPDAVRAKMGTPNSPKRPAGFVPKSPEAEADNPRLEEVETPALRDMGPFFKYLAEVRKSRKVFRTTVEMHDKKKRTKAGIEVTREKVNVRTAVELGWGADGLPFTVEPVAADEIHLVRARQYPEAPALSPTLGDLTPEFVEWLYLNHQYDAAVRYFGRSTHVQTAALDRQLA